MKSACIKEQQHIKGLVPCIITVHRCTYTATIINVYIYHSTKETELTFHFGMMAEVFAPAYLSQ